jgi:arylsulfatase A-like enzyme
MTRSTIPRWILKRAFTVIAGILLMGVIAGEFGCREASDHSQAGPRRPDVIIITLDTTRADRIGCYGYHRGITPNIDAFAAHATRFARVSAPMPMTAPSHATMFTGRYPGAHGVLDNAWLLDRNIALLPDLLQDTGYRTGSFVAVRFLAGYGLDRGFDHVDLGFGDRYERPANDITDAANAWLDQSGGDQPILLWAHYYDPHHPYLPPRHTLPLLKDDPRQTQIDWDALREELMRELKPDFVRPDVIPYLLEQYAYDGEIQFMDEQVGRLLDHLRQTGHYDNALIVIAGDHGEGFGEHPKDIQHGETLYETTIHVPCLIKLPHQTGPRVVESLASLADMLPTVLEALAMPVPRECQGLSLLPTLEGDPAPWDEAARTVFIERRRYRPYADADTRPAAARPSPGDTQPAIALTRPAHAVTLPAPTHPAPGDAPPAHTDTQPASPDVNGGRMFDVEMYAVRDPRWKLIWSADGQRQLFDLDHDPGEFTNLADRHPEIVERLENALAGFHEQCKAISVEGVPSSSKDTLEMLRALGYVK